MYSDVLDDINRSLNSLFSYLVFYWDICYNYLEIIYDFRVIFKIFYFIYLQTIIAQLIVTINIIDDRIWLPPTCSHEKKWFSLFHLIWTDNPYKYMLKLLFT